MRPLKIVTLVLVALAGTVLAQNISYDYDRTANFRAFKTYTWVAGTPVADQLNHQRVVRAIDAQLVKSGLERVETAQNPDVLVAYHATFDKDLQINGFGSGWGGYRVASRSMSASVDQILVGTLVVDVVDAKTRMIVWRGRATKDIDVNASAEKREKNINQTAGKLFKNYPPAR